MNVYSLRHHKTVMALIKASKLAIKRGWAPVKNRKGETYITLHFGGGRIRCYTRDFKEITEIVSSAIFD